MAEATPNPGTASPQTLGVTELGTSAGQASNATGDQNQAGADAESSVLGPHDVTSSEESHRQDCLRRFPATPGAAGTAMAEAYDTLRTEFRDLVEVLSRDEREHFVDIANNRMNGIRATDSPYSHWIGARALEENWIAWLFVRRIWPRSVLEQLGFYKHIFRLWVQRKSLFEDKLPLWYPMTRMEQHIVSRAFVMRVRRATGAEERERLRQEIIRGAHDGNRIGRFRAKMYLFFTDVDLTVDREWQPGGGVMELAKYRLILYPDPHQENNQIDEIREESERAWQASRRSNPRPR